MRLLIIRTVQSRLNQFPSRSRRFFFLLHIIQKITNNQSVVSVCSKSNKNATKFPFGKTSRRRIGTRFIQWSFFRLLRNWKERRPSFSITQTCTWSFCSSHIYYRVVLFMAGAFFFDGHPRRSRWIPIRVRCSRIFLNGGVSLHDVVDNLIVPRAYFKRMPDAAKKPWAVPHERKQTPISILFLKGDVYTRREVFFFGSCRRIPFPFGIDYGDIFAWFH